MHCCVSVNAHTGGVCVSACERCRTRPYLRERFTYRFPKVAQGGKECVRLVFSGINKRTGSGEVMNK